MMWFKKLLHKWVTDVIRAGDKPANKTYSDFATAINSPTVRPESTPECQVTLRKAMNGYFLELAQHKPQQRGPDWQYTYFVLEDTADLANAIAALLVNQRLSDK